MNEEYLKQGIYFSSHLFFFISVQRQEKHFFYVIFSEKKNILIQVIWSYKHYDQCYVNTWH